MWTKPKDYTGNHERAKIGGDEGQGVGKRTHRARKGKDWGRLQESVVGTERQEKMREKESLLKYTMLENTTKIPNTLHSNVKLLI